MKRIIIIALVLAAIAGMVVLKKSRQAEELPLPAHTAGLPRLLDLGSKGCTACTMLEPILEELRTTYTGRLQVDFIDVWKHPQIATDYGVEIIPTQIFFNADGIEIHRHQGFISVEDVVKKFEELGIALNVE